MSMPFSVTDFDITCMKYFGDENKYMHHVKVAS